MLEQTTQARARTKEDLWIYFVLKPLSHQSGVLTAFPQRLKNAERRGARCANASNDVQTLWKRCAIA